MSVSASVCVRAALCVLPLIQAHLCGLVCNCQAYEYCQCVYWRQRVPATMATEQTTVARTAQKRVPSKRIMALTAQNDKPVSEDPKTTWQDRLNNNKPVSEDHGADRAKQRSCQRQRRLRRTRKGGLRPRAVKCGIGLSLRLLSSSLLSSSWGLSCPKQLRQIYVARSAPLVQLRLCSQECGKNILDLHL